MRVGITLRTMQASSYHDPRDALSHDWIRYAEKMGWMPIMIPNALEDLGGWLDAVGPIDAFILSNGNNVDLPGRSVEDRSPLRDRTESLILDFALQHQKKLLGVCRGFQFINAYFDGEVDRVDPKKHVATEHVVELEKSLNERGWGDQVLVNSFHQYGVLYDRCAACLDVLATSDDGRYVEMVGHQSKPILGILWHPERAHPASSVTDDIIQTFFRQGIFWGAARSIEKSRQ